MMDDQSRAPPHLIRRVVAVTTDFIFRFSPMLGLVRCSNMISFTLCSLSPNDIKLPPNNFSPRTARNSTAKTEWH